jgi:hypothetical protein
MYWNGQKVLVGHFIIIVSKHLPFCSSFKELCNALQNFKISISGKIIEFANNTIWQAKKCIKSYMSRTWKLLWPTISINVHNNKINRSKSLFNHTQINIKQGKKDIYT